MRVVVAPDKFRGTLTAAEAAGAIAAGWHRVRPHDEIDEIPLADGGEGTLDVLVDAFGGRRGSAEVHGPLGDLTEAEYGLVPRGDKLLGVVEMSRASGLRLVPDGRRDILRATTRGTGELIVAACREATDVLVCLGGSATNDAGAGMAQALGFRLLDHAGDDIGPGGASLLALSTIEAAGIDRDVQRARFLVACDVDNPLTGAHGASVVYGPQKGAGPRDVRLLDQALTHFADVVRRDLGVDVRDLPGAGAAGGLGAGVVAFLGAELRPGVVVVMEAVGFADRLDGADLVITGEGKLDDQSLRGKVPAGVVRHARVAGVDTAILCGRSEVRPDDVVVESLVEHFGEHRAMAEPARSLEDLAALVAERGTGDT
ncbi:MAG: glycerate kinase [Actinobacteria bacterium]|nr:glycerate kinase [Actinomycetota bacterium]